MITTDFPDLGNAELIFGQIPKQEEWEKKAKEAGFKFLDGNIFSKYAMVLFYDGGKNPKKKKGITDEYYTKGIQYFKCWLGSWDPKHESKEEVTGYILSLISNEKWIKKELKKSKQR